MYRYISFKPRHSWSKKLVILVMFLVLIGPIVYLEPISYFAVNLCISSCGKPTTISNENDAQCTKYNFKAKELNITHKSIPIYDFFIFNDEFDILEIRLHELYPYVTLFLIAESRQTLSGKEKIFHLQENWSKFSKYHDKIRRIEIQLDLNTRDQWANEHRMRDEGLRAALSTVKESKYLLLTSDTDEIPKDRFMKVLSNCILPDPFVPLVLDCDFYYYSYEYRSVPHKHFGSTITLVHSTELQSVSGAALRNRRSNFRTLASACFHCTWCFNQLKTVQSKMASYSHREHNEDRFRKREHILDRYRFGTDLFDRPGETYAYLRNNTDYPVLVKSQPERFYYMTKRSNLTNVGFIDA